ncbi:unnamed protein product [Clonostachys chloroleuca]|uniref:Deacetylase sirtuin-type domain-containing protein n=1 Tax=Clonostachys chloroleuca TaxID=1926264 RepID=A0AA35LQ19_9HYPO|nr:unnamed protein product [Clonostachys chloroleuca]
MSEASISKMASFHAALRSSRRVLSLCGAGLSASSGLPTFRGAGGLWRNYDATTLATPEAFQSDPGLVWLFYAYRRHMALRAEPNKAHRYLAALSREKPDFLCLTQNVDNLSQRANHNPDMLLPLHGSLFDIKCTNCDWIQEGNYDDPFCSALSAASVDVPPGETLPLLDPNHQLNPISRDELPKCPACKVGLQRPGVVWFGEKLDDAVLQSADDFVNKEPVDMMLVIGTSAQVWPAAGYIEMARARGARVVVVDPSAQDEAESSGGELRDFAFAGDAAELLPDMLQPVVGRLQDDGTSRKD